MTKPIRTGIFVGAGMLVFIAAIFALGSRQQLFSSRFTIYAQFETVAGLQQGAFVQYAGITVGTVSRIALPDSAQGLVTVALRLQTDARQLIRKNSDILIDTEGLIGGRYIIVEAGTRAKRVVVDGDTLRGEDPIVLVTMTEEVKTTLRDVRDLIRNAEGAFEAMQSIVVKTDAGEGALGRFINDTTLYSSLDQTIIQFGNAGSAARNLLVNLEGESHEVLAQIKRTGQIFERVGRSFENLGDAAGQIAAKINAGEGSLGKMVYDEALYTDARHAIQASDSLLAQAEQTVRDVAFSSSELARSVEEARRLMQNMADKIDRGEGTIGRLMTEDSVYVFLNNSMGNMEIATEKFAENMEAMRTNWLFRGYFSERGYWDNLEQDIELIEEREAQLRELEDRLNTQAAELERRERGNGSGSR